MLILNKINRSLNLRLLSILHILLTILVFLLIPLPLSPDEAHYYLWSENLDWAYYSKGPMLAIIIYLSHAFFPDFAEHSVRLPALFFSICSILVVAEYLRHNFDRKKSVILYLTIFTSPALWYQSIIMTTDAPVLFFWLSSVLFFDRAIKSEKTLDFIILFILIGLGFWSKYTIVLLAAIFFIYIFKKNKIKKDFYVFSVCALILILFSLPILYWNYSHNWVNFAHNAGHLGAGKSKGIKLFYVLDFIGGQLAVFGLFLFPYLFHVFRIIKEKKVDELSYPAKAGICLFLICLLVSLIKRIYPNWTIPAFPMAVLFMPGLFLNLFSSNKKFYIVSIAFNSLLSFMGILLLFGCTFSIPGKYLPTKKMHGWFEFSESIKAITKDTGIVMTESYDNASELSYYLNDVKIYNLPISGRRMNQFDIWQKNVSDQYVGKDVLLLFSKPEIVDDVKSLFDSISPIQPSPYFEYDLNGEKIRKSYLYIGKNLKSLKFNEIEKR